MSKIVEHAISLFKAAVAEFPGGAAIGVLIDEYLLTHSKRAASQMMDQLRERLEQLETQDRLDVNALDKDEFAELFKSCFLASVRTHRIEKHRAAANLLANIALKKDDPERLPYTEVDHFARCIDTLSVGSIQVFGHAIAYALESLGRRKPCKLEREHVRVDFESIHERVPNMDRELLKGLLGELTTFNLLYSLGVPSVSREESMYHNHPFEATPLGYRFHQFILKPGSSDEKPTVS